jgi:predicted Zn-dependent peptidase
VVLSVAGNIDHEQVLNLCRDRLLDWKGGRPSSWSPSTNGWHGPALTLLNKRTEQTQILLAVRGVSSNDPDRHAVDLMSAILGEGMSSRLFMELREKRSLCYDVHTYATHYLDAGSFSVYAGVDPANAAPATEAILNELARVRDDVPEFELHKAKEITKGHILLRMEDTRSVAGWTGAQELLHHEVKSVDEVTAEIEAVTSNDVKRVAAQLIQSDRLALSIVGPHRSENRFLPLLKV